MIILFLFQASDVGSEKLFSPTAPKGETHDLYTKAVTETQLLNDAKAEGRTWKAAEGSLCPLVLALFFSHHQIAECLHHREATKRAGDFKHPGFSHC